MRVQVDPSAPIRVDIMGRGFLDVLSARDISMGGLGISVPHGFAGCDIDSEVELIVTLGRARPFKTRGAIRHKSAPGCGHVFGVEFTALSADQQQAIEAYIRTCLRRRSRRSMAAVVVLTRVADPSLQAHVSTSAAPPVRAQALPTCARKAGE